MQRIFKMLLSNTIPDDLANLAISGGAVGFAAGARSFLEGSADVMTNYEESWQDLYFKRGWLTHDPVIHSGTTQVGARRWKLENASTEFGTAANDFGLKQGIVASSKIGGSLCIAGLSMKACATDIELDRAFKSVRRLHIQRLIAKSRDLSESQQQLVSLFSMGLRAKEVASELSISEDAIKQRKLTIQTSLGVDNFLVVINICARADEQDHLINIAH